jgi:hypothetical protein
VLGFHWDAGQLKDAISAGLQTSYSSGRDLMITPELI